MLVSDPCCPGLSESLMVFKKTLADMVIVVSDPNVIFGRRKYSLFELRPEMLKVTEVALLALGLVRTLPSESNTSSRNWRMPDAFGLSVIDVLPNTSDGMMRRCIEPLETK